MTKHKSISDIARGDSRKPPALFHDFLLQKAVTMVSAEPFTGKSMFALALTLALDSNRALMGTFNPMERRKVLFIGQDSPEWDYAEQIRKLVAGYELTSDDLDKLDSEAIFNDGFDILDKGRVELLHNYYDEHGFDVIIFDTLASIHTLDENSNREMGYVMRALKNLRDKFQCTVIFTHHDSKPNGDERSAVYRPRGASIISGSCDVHISLRSGSDGSVKLTMPKGRGISSHRRRVVYTMDDCGTPDNPGVRLVAKQEGPDFIKVVEAALKKGATSRLELVTAVRESGCPAAQSGTATDNALAALLRAGKVERPARGKWKLKQGG
jgi:KaiC/GvpD/RAD55 family RecA-like ATPase